jgi:hypothetical protein
MPKANKYSRRQYKRGGVKVKATDANLFSPPPVDKSIVEPLYKFPKGTLKTVDLNKANLNFKRDDTFDRAAEELKRLDESRQMAQEDRAVQQQLLNQLADDYLRPMPQFGSQDDDRTCTGPSCTISGGRKTRSRMTRKIRRGRKSRKSRRYRRSRRH